MQRAAATVQEVFTLEIIISNQPTNSQIFDFIRKGKWKPLGFTPPDKTKVPLIIFGDGMFGKDGVKIKGIRTGVVGKLWRCIKRREALGDLLAIPIDEYLTSQICSKCRTRTLNSHSAVKGNSVQVCTTCSILFQRDVNAAKNMLWISLSTWNGDGRPEAYQRT